MTYKITVLPGDGIGPEVMDATTKVVEATGLDIEWDRQLLGGEAFLQTGELLPQETIHSIKTNKIAIKGPTATPSGAGHRSLNVSLREEFDLYANLRPVRSMPGVKTRFSDTPIDLIVVRENLEDLYIGEEKKIPGGFEAISRFTAAECERISRFAFGMAREKGRKKVTVVTKPNILKMTHGLFQDTALRIGRDEFPEIVSDAYIMDNFQMQLLQHPERFDCLLFPNLFGDLASDLCAGLIGGLGFAPGANIGPRYAIFEAVHGTAPDIAGKGIANPTALILSSALMLDHLGEPEAAERIRRAIDCVLLEAKVVTGDVNPQVRASTDEFAEAVCKKL